MICGQCRRDDSFPFISSTTSACHQIHQRRPTVNRRGSQWTHWCTIQALPIPYVHDQNVSTTQRSHILVKQPSSSPLGPQCPMILQHYRTHLVLISNVVRFVRRQERLKAEIARGVTRDSEAARHKISPVKIHRYLHSLDWRGDLEEQASQDS